jgi:hypothetical protein
MAIENPITFIGKTVDDDVTEEERLISLFKEFSKHLARILAFSACVKQSRPMSPARNCSGVCRLAGGDPGS